METAKSEKQKGKKRKNQKISERLLNLEYTYLALRRLRQHDRMRIHAMRLERARSVKSYVV
jgi:hypothetical protein